MIGLQNQGFHDLMNMEQDRGYGYGNESSQGPQGGPPRDLGSVHMGNPSGGLLGSDFGEMASAPGGAPPGGPQPGGNSPMMAFSNKLLGQARDAYAPANAPPMRQAGPMNAPRPQFG